MEQTNKIPSWYWVAAIFFLIWNALGVFSFIGHTFITEEALAALPENERALYGEYPLWTTLVFALAVFGGTLGSIGLLVRKKWAKTAFIVSLTAIVPQMIHNLFFTRSMEVYGPGQASTMPVLVVLFGIYLVWYSNRLIQRGWLN